MKAYSFSFKLLVLTSSLPIIILYIYSIPLLRFYSLINTISFIVGMILPLAFMILEYKYKVTQLYYIVISYVVLTLLSRFIIISQVYSGFLYAIPLMWILTPILSKSYRTWYTITIPVVAYSIALINFVSLSLASADLLGLTFLEVLSSCLKSFITPIIPLTIAYPPPTIVTLLYPFSVLSSITTLIWNGTRLEGDVYLVEAFKRIFYTTLFTMIPLILLLNLLPFRYGMIVYPLYIVAIIVYIVKATIQRTYTYKG